MTVTIIVHGAVWPELRDYHAWLAEVRAAVPGAAIVEAREHAESPRGAAAAIAEAIAGSDSEQLVVIEAGRTLDLAAFMAVVASAPRALVVEADAAGRTLAWPGPAQEPDLIRTLAASIAGPAPAPPAAAMRAWALSRDQFVDAGGLDGSLGSIGVIEHLAARLGPDVPVVAAPASPVLSHPAWPLPPAIAQALGWRNRLMTALEALPAEWLGLELARVATEALRASTLASGLTGEQFHFGGDWGVGEGSVARLLRPGAHGAAHLADPVGTLLPLLALDSAVEELPRLLERRRGRPPLDPGDPGTPSGLHRPLQEPADAAPARPPDGTSAASSHGHPPRVSVIVVNWNGLEHLRDCFGSLLRSDYPADRLEIVCVDNGSTDRSVALLREEFPAVQVVQLPRNEGFTGGNAAGVAASTGDVLVFFNNDMRVEPDAVRHLVGALDGVTACAAARVLSWDGRFVDFVRGAINFEARGFQDFYGEPAASELVRSPETFFPNGGAFAVTRDAYDRAGGFDESFFAYYDDVDLGWRLRSTGAAIRVVDTAVVYHRHGATSRIQPKGQKQFLMERNAIWTVMKNYGEAALHRTLGAVLLLATRRLVDEVRLDPEADGLRPFAAFSRRLAGASGSPRPARQAVLGLPAESLAAIGAALDALPAIAGARSRLQAARRTPDELILPHVGRTFERLSAFTSYAPIHDGLVEALALAPLFRPRTRLLIVSHEAIAVNMSGPAVRFLEIARALAAEARVTIAMPGTPLLRDDRCAIAGFDPATPAALQRLAEDADVIFVQGFALTQYPFLTRLMRPIVVDLYCPFTVEHLEQTRGRRPPDDDTLAAEAAGILAVQNTQLDLGDFFLCASEIQRDFWIGNLHSRGRVNPRTYAADSTLRGLIDVVPFGVPDQPFEAAARALPPVLKGVRPGIAATDTLLLWGGSLLDWQDPVTLIEAIALLAPARPDVKLVFMGTRHPNPLVAPMRVVEESRSRAEALGLLDRHVFFNDWVPYTERARYLFEADLGVSTHREHLETHFSFRTRMLDYVWARLPIVCTEGDVFASLVAARGLGTAVPPGEPHALARALDALLSDRARRDAAREALEALGHELRWSRVVEPLARFLRAPAHAADHEAGVARIHARLASSYRLSKWLKRTALGAGMTEQRIEQIKRLAPVRALMAARNRIAIERARRRARRG